MEMNLRLKENKNQTGFKIIKLKKNVNPNIYKNCTSIFSYQVVVTFNSYRILLAH